MTAPLTIVGRLAALDRLPPGTLSAAEQDLVRALWAQHEQGTWAVEYEEMLEDFEALYLSPLDGGAA